MARRLGIVLLVVLAMAVTAAPSQSTTSTSTTSSTTASTTSTTAPGPPPLPSCREVLASNPKGSISGDDPTRIRIAGLPHARQLTVDLHYTDGSPVEVRNCVSLLSSSGEELATQDSAVLCCVRFDHRFSVLLPHQPAPGTRVCAQEALRETLRDGTEVAFVVLFTNRVCLVMPGASPGELPFTGPAHTVPLAALAALAIVLGVAVLLAASGPQQRSE
jgi:hypothetical protein